MPKLIHERWKCIGCGMCVAMDPETWEMAEDGKSIMKIEHSEHKTDDGIIYEAEIDNARAEKNKEIEDGCPSRCIHIK